jgi:hypothetical protein
MKTLENGWLAYPAVAIASISRAQFFSSSDSSRAERNHDLMNLAVYSWKTSYLIM